MLTVYVPGMSDVARDSFNAIAAYTQSGDWVSIIGMVLTISVAFTMIAWIQLRDIMVFGKFVLTYIIVTSCLLFPTSLAIYDQTDPGKSAVVDNVPLGVAFPAGVLSSVFFAITKGIETVFHLPADLNYTQTGMLFGSKLMMNAMNGVSLKEAELKKDFSTYVSRCVMPDVVMGRISWADISKNNNIFAVLDTHQSPIRGFTYGGSFQTCSKIYPDLKGRVIAETNGGELQNLAAKLFGRPLSKKENIAEQVVKLKANLPTANEYFTNLSRTASEIIMQNVLIKEMQDGASNYAATSKSTAALLNYGFAVQQQRLAMANMNSYNMATYTLPMSQFFFFLFLCCMAPFIFLLMFMPNMSVSLGKTYIGALIWVGSWPIGFAVINFFVTAAQYYATGDANGGIVLDNYAGVAKTLSDFASTAGYMALSVPILMLGLVKGMAQTSANAAQYFGGMQHSISGAIANEQQTGNFSVANTNVNTHSFDNVNGHKHDINGSYFGGQTNYNSPSGAVFTRQADGSDTINTSAAVSSFPMGLRGSSVISQAMQQEAREHHQHATHERQTAQQNYSTAFNEMKSLDHQLQSGQAINEGWSDTQTTNVRNALETATSYIDRNGQEKAIQTLHDHQESSALNTQFGGSASLSGGSKGGSGSKESKAGLNIGGTMSNTYQSSEQDRSTFSSNRGISTSEDERFAHAIDTLRSSGVSLNSSDSSSTGDSELSRISSSLDQAYSHMHQADIDESQAVSLGKAATHSENNSTAVDANYATGFQKFMFDQLERTDALARLGNPNMANDPVVRAYANSYARKMGHEFQERFESDKSSIEATQSLIKNQGTANMNEIASENGIFERHQDNKQTIKDSSPVNFDESKYSQVKSEAATRLSTNDTLVASGKQRLDGKNSTFDNTTETNVINGDKNASRPVLLAPDRKHLNDSTKNESN